jgi:hypothetical protein
MSNQSRISEEINGAYFTSAKSSEFCVDMLETTGWLKHGTTVIEPAAGDGALLRALASSKFKLSVRAYDIEDYGCGAQIEDYLNATTEKADLVFANPPFGKMANLAVKFFNRACKDSNRLAFIVPQSFRKLSIIDRLDLDFWPVYDSDLPDETYTLPDKSKRVVKTCFQLWERRTHPRAKLNSLNYSKFVTALTKEQALITEGAYAIRGQGSKAGKVLNGLDYSEASTRFLVGNQEIITSLDLSKLASFTAGIPSIGLTELAYAVSLSKEDRSKLNDFLMRGAVALLGCASSQSGTAFSQKASQ